jgi:hypothetical protein
LLAKFANPFAFFPENDRPPGYVVCEFTMAK